MSISFRQIRKTSTAQGRFKDLVSDYQRFLAEQVTVDNPDFRVKARTMYSKLAYLDPFITHKIKPIDTAFYLTHEPDAKHLVGMWALDHNGRFCNDGAGSKHVGRFIRNAGLREGIDNGFGNTLYVRFDGTTLAYVDNAQNLRLSFFNSFTITVRIYPEDLSATDGPGGTKYRTILHKPDSSNIPAGNQGLVDTFHVAQGYHLAVTPNGRVRFTLMRSGIRYTVETLPNVIVASAPPFPYDITVTVDQLNRRSIPQELTVDPGDVPGSDPGLEAPYTPGTTAPKIEISVNNNFYAIYSVQHLSFVDDSLQRLRFGGAYPYSVINSPNPTWFFFKGGIQQIRFYLNRILTFAEISNYYRNKITIADIPFGSPALAGSTLVLDPAWVEGFDPAGYESEGYMTGFTAGVNGFPGYDPTGFDEIGYDTLAITTQGALQGGGYDPRGFSDVGFDTIPFSQS